MTVIIGTSLDDNLVGGIDNDLLIGYLGNDFLNGEDGNDLLCGGDGNDSLYGGSGNNLLFGGNGKDSLYGGNGKDTLHGGCGDDELVGAEGDELIYGGNGNDGLYGGGGGNDKLFGGSGNDALYSSYGNDTLYGGSGNDIINGAGVVYPDARAGQSLGTGEIDVLTGGMGKDIFQLWGGNARSGVNPYYNDFDSSTAGTSDYALITDFNPSEDVILLTRYAVYPSPPATVEYSLAASPNGLPVGTAILINNYFVYDQPDTGAKELIAIVQGITLSSLDLDASYFYYG